jgi:hypothetical protein
MKEGHPAAVSRMKDGHSASASRIKEIHPEIATVNFLMKLPQD